MLFLIIFLVYKHTAAVALLKCNLNLNRQRTQNRTAYVHHGFDDRLFIYIFIFCFTSLVMVETIQECKQTKR